MGLEPRESWYFVKVVLETIFFVLFKTWEVCIWASAISFQAVGLWGWQGSSQWWGMKVCQHWNYARRSFVRTWGRHNLTGPGFTPACTYIWQCSVIVMLDLVTWLALAKDTVTHLMQREALLGFATVKRTSLLEGNKRSLGESQVTWAKDILEHPATADTWASSAKISQTQFREKAFPPQLTQRLMSCNN